MDSQTFSTTLFDSLETSERCESLFIVAICEFMLSRADTDRPRISLKEGEECPGTLTEPWRANKLGPLGTDGGAMERCWCVCWMGGGIFSGGAPANTLNWFAGVTRGKKDILSVSVKTRVGLAGAYRRYEPLKLGVKDRDIFLVRDGPDSTRTTVRD